MVRGLIALLKRGEVRAAAGALASAGVAVALYVRPDTATALAVSAGLLVVVIGLQMESLFRSAESDRRWITTEQALREYESIPLLVQLKSRATPEATESWMQPLASRFILELCSDRHGELARIASNLSTFGTFEDVVAVMLDRLPRTALDDAFAAAVLDKQKKEIVTFFDQLAGGVVDVRNSVSVDHGLILWLTEHLQRSLWGTNIYSKRHLRPDTPGGGAYWSWQKEAILSRGVEVRRIFIYESEWPEELEALASVQASVGVLTYRVEEAVLRRERLLLQIGIWDDQYASSLNFGADGRVTDSPIWFADNERIARTCEQFKTIEGLAERYP